MTDPRHVDIVYRLRQPIAHTTSELVGIAHLHAEAANRIVVLEGALRHAEREFERLRDERDAATEDARQFQERLTRAVKGADRMRAGVESLNRQLNSATTVSVDRQREIDGLRAELAALNQPVKLSEWQELVAERDALLALLTEVRCYVEQDDSGLSRKGKADMELLDRIDAARKGEA